MWRKEFGLRVSDFDGLGRLTATACFILFEETRADWLMKSLQAPAFRCVVASQRLDFVHEAMPDAGPITVSLAVRTVGESSVDIVESLSAESTVCARSEATLVLWDAGRRAPRPITEAERAMFESHAPAQDNSSPVQGIPRK
ncbi:thioesterase family protein [Amycolatopsis sp. Poz14]|uniref:acyl-CoA thioesterase n=1 Tax=Amycolatopsis sp. Poz14 TaxID=1447705 RepID=UPI001EE7DC50|nr:hypothetical protein [Amycolatopsis sp. Poz14]MCG3752644.1 hypothetical protein [Amycolatopsis sp. Poz14]